MTGNPWVLKSISNFENNCLLNTVIDWFSLDTKVEAHDVAIMMSLLKIARTKLGAVSKDTYVDMAAYGAIAGEIKFKEK